VPDTASTARLTAFATAATLTAAQDVTRAALPIVQPGADAELVAEETLVLAATLTSRAVEVGLREKPDVLASVAPALQELPLLYHDVLFGTEAVASGAQGEVAADPAVYERLARKAGFYAAHFAPGQFPGPRALADKLPLWMGRISPPKLPSTPEDRLGDTGAVDRLAVHTRLVLAFAQQVG
jgi:hypothetical protein